MPLHYGLSEHGMKKISSHVVHPLI